MSIPFKKAWTGFNPLLTLFSVLRTDSEKYAWVNWASFIVEWQANFNTGGAEFQFSNISTGGRVDGKPIPVLEPPSGK